MIKHTILSIVSFGMVLFFIGTSLASCAVGMYLYTALSMYLFHLALNFFVQIHNKK